MNSEAALTVKRRTLALALICIGAVAAAPAVEFADGKKKKKVDKRVGTYEGTREDGGTVRFRINKRRQVVDFIAPNAALLCSVIPPPGQAQPPDSQKGTVNITAPPIPLQGVAKFVYSDPYPGPGLPYARNFVDGKPGVGFSQFNELKGDAGFGSSNGDGGPGTETCATGQLDWTARPVSGPAAKKGKKKN